MSRYRPPRTAGTPLITPEGEARLRAELHELWNVRRPQVTQAVSEAAALGDRSENAEYIYGKKMLREIDSRVRFLRKRLENLKVVRDRPGDPNKVFAQPVEEVMVTRLETISADAPIADLVPLFRKDYVAIVMDRDRFLGLATRLDLINYFRIAV